MEFDCKNIEITNSELGVQVLFDRLNGNSELYFLIQKHYDEEDGRDEVSYIETHNFDLAGHYSTRIILGKSICEFEYGGNRLAIAYKADDLTYEELKETLKILGSVEIKMA